MISSHYLLLNLGGGRSLMVSDGVLKRFYPNPDLPGKGVGQLVEERSSIVEQPRPRMATTNFVPHPQLLSPVPKGTAIRLFALLAKGLEDEGSAGRKCPHYCI